MDRFGEQDRELYPEIERLMQEGHLSPTAAALRLAYEDKVAGLGSTPESRASRLAKRYRRETQ